MRPCLGEWPQGGKNLPLSGSTTMIDANKTQARIANVTMSARAESDL